MAGATTQSKVRDVTHLPYNGAKDELQDLQLLGLAGQSSDLKEWHLDEEQLAKLNDTGLAERFTRKVPPEGR